MGNVSRASLFIRNRLRSVVLGCLIILWAAVFLSFQLQAQTPFTEEVIFIKEPSFFSDSQLEATFFKPEGSGPFPLVVINHGQNLGNPHQQERFRPMSMVNYFLERNYVVLVPMRKGFDKSEGEYTFVGNSVELLGKNSAADIRATIDYAHTLTYIDKTTTVVVGQSAGGWVTIAYGANNPDPSVKGLVNFSGVLKENCCMGTYKDLIDASGKFGAESTLPSIWFYGDNDSLIDLNTAKSMFRHYSAGNPNARFIPYGVFLTDAHQLMMNPAGREVWESYLTQFLHDIGAPYQAPKRK